MDRWRNDGQQRSAEWQQAGVRSRGDALELLAQFGFGGTVFGKEKETRCVCVNLVSGGRGSFVECLDYRVPQLAPPPLDTWLLNLTGIPLLAHICATFINELCASLITFWLFIIFWLFDPCQRLIARNDRELFSSNRGISHLNEACRIDELSRGSVLGLKFSQTTSDWNVP
jgi:hypothetical protein